MISVSFPFTFSLRFFLQSLSLCLLFPLFLYPILFFSFSLYVSYSLELFSSLLLILSSCYSHQCFLSFLSLMLSCFLSFYLLLLSLSLSLSLSLFLQKDFSLSLKQTIFLSRSKSLSLNSFLFLTPN
jgi:hypothetical protein